MLAQRYRDSWGEHLRGNSGYVTQFAIGRPAGAQQCGIAVQELLAVEPTFEAHAIDLKNAFNEIAQCTMTRGILACNKDGGHEALPFFLSMHQHLTELFYHRYDGTVVLKQHASALPCPSPAAVKTSLTSPSPATPQPSPAGPTSPTT